MRGRRRAAAVVKEGAREVGRQLEQWERRRRRAGDRPLEHHLEDRARRAARARELARRPAVQLRRAAERAAFAGAALAYLRAAAARIGRALFDRPLPFADERLHQLDRALRLRADPGRPRRRRARGEKVDEQVPMAPSADAREPRAARAARGALGAGARRRPQRLEAAVARRVVEAQPAHARPELLAEYVVHPRAAKGLAVDDRVGDRGDRRPRHAPEHGVVHGRGGEDVRALAGLRRRRQKGVVELSATMQWRGARAAAPADCVAQRRPAQGEAERVEESDQQETACHRRRWKHARRGSHVDARAVRQCRGISGSFPTVVDPIRERRRRGSTSTCHRRDLRAGLVHHAGRPRRDGMRRARQPRRASSAPPPTRARALS